VSSSGAQFVADLSMDVAFACLLAGCIYALCLMPYTLCLLADCRFVAYLSMDDGFASDISKPPELRDDPEHIGLINGFLVALNPKP
jgi:hypothetical protein